MSKRSGRFQFTLRTLLIVTTAFAAVMAYVTSVLRRHEVTGRIVRCVERHKGKGLVKLDIDDVIYYPLDADKDSLKVPLDRYLFGPELTARVAGIGLGFTSLSADDLAIVGKADHLRWLDLTLSTFDEDAFLSLPLFPDLRLLVLDGCELSAREIRHVARYRWLKELHLNGIKLSESSLAELGSLDELEVLMVCTNDHLTGAQMPLAPLLPKLRRFDAAGTPWNDVGIERLVTHKGLEDVRLDEESLTEKGLGLLATLPNLRGLCLWGYKGITDAGMEQIGKMRALEALGLGCTNITDAQLSYLAAADNIQELDLMRTKISDAGIAHLLRLRKLRGLNLLETTVTDQGIEKLAELPALEILNVSHTKVTQSGMDRLRSLSKKVQFEY